MRKCGEGVDQDRGIVYMSRYEVLVFVLWAEEGNGGTTTSPSGAASEAGMGVTATEVAIVSSREANQYAFGGTCRPRW